MADTVGRSSRQAVRADVEAVVGHVVQVLARHQPHDVADLSVRVVVPQPGEGFRCDVPVLGGAAVARVVKGCSFGVAEQRARLVLGQRISGRGSPGTCAARTIVESPCRRGSC